MRVSLTNEGWLYQGMLWDAEFARAIAPVDFQRILAKRLRKRARRSKDIMVKMHILQKAKSLEALAKADAECEVKWGAREQE